MKIIKRGVDPASRTYQATCHGCGTAVEFAQSEAKYVPDQKDGDHLRVKCPVCPRDITTHARLRPAPSPNPPPRHP